MAGRRETPLMKNSAYSFRLSRICVFVVIGLFCGCIFAFLFPGGILHSQPQIGNIVTKSNLQTESSAPACETSEEYSNLKSKMVDLSTKNAELQKQVMDLSRKLSAEKLKVGRGTQKIDIVGPGQETGPEMTPGIGRNEKLAEILEQVAPGKEVMVTLANSNVEAMLEVWFKNIQRVGISSYLVVALDDHIADFCAQKGVPVYKREGDEAVDSVGKTGGNHAVSALKYHILKEFLELGYSVLLSDVDIVYLGNPFEHLYRDSDVESMSDGHDNGTAYGYDDVYDEPGMGWARYAHTIRIWVYNSGLFYLRPTQASMELMDRVGGRLVREKGAWDQAVFNEELFFPSHPGYRGLQATKRTMDMYLFMNSKVLFKRVRNDGVLLRGVSPVAVHINYHPDKLPRMKAVVEFYVNGRKDALDPFPDGSQ